MKNIKSLFTPIALAFALLGSLNASADIRLSFDRQGTDGNSVKVIVQDAAGNALPGVTGTVFSSYPFMPNKGKVNEKILCPNINATNNPNIKLTFTLKGLKSPQAFKYLKIDIHAFNQGGGYQRNINDKARKFNVKAEVGAVGQTLTPFGMLEDIDIAANVGTENNVHQFWTIENEKGAKAAGDYQITLTVTKGSVNAGCFFGLSDIVLAENASSQEDHAIPFKTSPEIGKPYACYSIASDNNERLAMTEEGKLSWMPEADQTNQVWYFVEKGKGVQIVNLDQNKLLNAEGEEATIWTLLENEGGKNHSFIPLATQEDSTTRLTVDGKSALLFYSVRNSFARHCQIYEIPCGALGQQYITRLNVAGDIVKPMHYPLNVLNGDAVSQPEGAVPTSEFYVYTEDQATAAAGQTMEIEVELNEAPAEGMEGFLYFDWNRDGAFETSQAFHLAKSSTVQVQVPANVTPGRSRARIRLTENGFQGADQEVNGQIFDWILHLKTTAAEEHAFTAVPNDANRGTAVAEKVSETEAKAVATPMGNAQFICWREGLQLLSLDKEYVFPLNHDTHLVAYFSPNTDAQTGLEEAFAEHHQAIEITTGQKTIQVKSTARIVSLMVFRPDGKLIAQTHQDTLHLDGVPAGTYIVKAYTATADKSAKILLK